MNPLMFQIFKCISLELYLKIMAKLSLISIVLVIMYACYDQKVEATLL